MLRKYSGRPDSGARGSTRGLACWIVLTYLAQGIGQHFCLLAQPLENFLLKVLHANAAHVAFVLALLMVPWTVKPLYGFISDAFPIYGSSKRIYVFLAFLLGAIGYSLAAFTSGSMMTLGLVLSSLGMAWASAVLLGLVVQAFSKKAVPYLFCAQNFAYYSTCTGAGVAGGLLCQSLPPDRALKMACCVAASAALFAAFGSLFLIREPVVSRVSLRALSEKVRRFIADHNFILLALFTFCWSFSPSFGAPLYFHYTNVLHLTQARIGEANGFNSLGLLAGTMVYSLLWRFAPRQQTQLCICFSIFTTLAFILLSAQTANVFEFGRGISTMLGALSITSLGAAASQPGIETLTTAVLISVYNFGTQLSGIVGGNLYSHVFPDQFWPLLVISAATTAFAGCLTRLADLPHFEIEDDSLKGVVMQLPAGQLPLPESSGDSGRASHKQPRLIRR